MPVASAARPVPSTLTDSAICVSAVLRSALAARVDIATSFWRIAYTKSALGERFRERLETAPVLLRRPDGEPDTPFQKRHSRIQVLDGHPAAPHPLEHRGRVGNANQYEIRVARKNRDSRKPAQLGVEALALVRDAAGLRVEHVVVREDSLGDDVGQRVDVVGRTDLVEFADPFRPSYRVAQAYSGEAELRQGA